MDAIELLKAQRDLHITRAKNRLAMAAALAGHETCAVAPVQASIDADKHAFTAGILDQILRALGEK
jgi:hypothetical protein